MLSWAAGTWGGDPDAVTSAAALCRLGTTLDVTPHGPRVVADPGDPLAALAVMRAVLGGNLALTGAVPQVPRAPAVDVGEDLADDIAEALDEGDR